MSTEELINRIRNSPEGKGAAGRARVHKLAHTDFREALSIARHIEHPWYRCQALAQISEANPKHPQAQSWLEEALSAAYSQLEPNRIASVSFWPLKVLSTLNPERAQQHAERLLQIISQEPHGLRRLHGLSGILRGIATLKEPRERTLELFSAAANSSAGWRTDRCVSGISLVLAPLDLVAAIKLIESRPNNRFTRHAREQLLHRGIGSGKCT